MMGAGCKNRFITVNKLVQERDLGGAVVPKFEERCKVYAERIQKRGTETTEDHETVAVQFVEWVIWYRSDLKRTDRIVYDSVEFEIIDIQEVGFRHETRVFTRSLRTP